MSHKYSDAYSDDEGKSGEGKRDYASADAKESHDRSPGGGSKQSSNISDDELLSAVQQFFYGDTALGETFEKFVQDNAHVVDLDGLEANEFKLEYTELYNEYKDIFERKLEGYIENTLGSSIHTFYNCLSRKSSADPDSNEAIFGQILLAVTDFDIFMIMMKEAAHSQRRK